MSSESSKRPETPQARQRRGVTRGKLGGAAVGLATGAAAWALGASVVAGADSSKVLGQVERGGVAVKHDYLKGAIDPNAVQVVTLNPKGATPDTASQEASRITADPSNVPTMEDVLTDQDGASVPPDSVAIVPKDLLKPGTK